MIMIDIDMPDNCDECQFSTEYGFCKAMPDNFCGNTDDRKRPEWCPMKEQEVKNGEWITIWREDDPDTSTHARCSICNRVSERPLGGYCKWCGAKMLQEWGVDG